MQKTLQTSLQAEEEEMRKLKNLENMVQILPSKLRLSQKLQMRKFD